MLRGRSYVSAEVVKDTLRSRQGKELVGKGNRLTDRQRQVLQLLAEGMRMKEVGLALKITTRTVAFHKYRVMKVLKAKNDANLVQYAIKHHNDCRLICGRTQPEFPCRVELGADWQFSQWHCVVIGSNILPGGSNAKC